MASSETQNYALPQWAADDRIMREEFNGAMATIDSALHSKPELVFGTYTGNGAASRTISLGFTPKAVLVTASSGLVGYEASGKIYHYGGLALANAPTSISGQNVLAVVNGGFSVRNTGDSGDAMKIASNLNGTLYHYMAVR